MADEIKNFEEFTKFLKRKSNDGSTSVFITGPDYVNYSQIASEIVKNDFDPEKVKNFEELEVPSGPQDVKDFFICIGRPKDLDQVMLMFGENLTVVMISYSKKMLESFIDDLDSGVTERVQKDVSYNEIYGKIRQGQLLRSEVNTLSTLILHVVLDIPSTNVVKRKPEISDKTIKPNEKEGEIVQEKDVDQTLVEG